MIEVTPSTSTNPQPLPANRYSARASYFGSSGYSPSEGLKRARRPFRTRNALTGLAIMGFVASVYTYSISAVKQDDFSDLPATSPNAGKEGLKTIEEELAEKSSKAGIRGVGAMAGFGSSPQGEGVRVSSTESPVADQNASHFASPQPSPLASPLPGALQATPSTHVGESSSRGPSRLIVGAPDVDRLGKLFERTDDSRIDGRRVA